MRVQTSFEKFAQITNGSLFSFCFIGLRLLLGLLALLMVTRSASSQIFSFAGTSEALASLSLVAGGILVVCFLFGLCVRPASFLVMALLAATIFVDPDITQHLSQALPTLGFILLLGMFAAGGSGHMFGLDGIIYRNIRRPSRLAKFLFG